MKAIDIRIILDNLNSTKVMNKAMPPKMALAVDANFQALAKEAASIEKQRVAIAERYAEKDKDGAPMIEDGQYVMTDKNKKIVGEEIDKLYSADVEVSIRKITEADIEASGSADRYDPLTPADISVLRFMIE